MAAARPSRGQRVDHGNETLNAERPRKAKSEKVKAYWDGEAEGKRLGTITRRHPCRGCPDPGGCFR